MRIFIPRILQLIILQTQYHHIFISCCTDVISFWSYKLIWIWLFHHLFQSVTTIAKQSFKVLRNSYPADKVNNWVINFNLCWLTMHAFSNSNWLLEEHFLWEYEHRDATKVVGVVAMASSWSTFVVISITFLWDEGNDATKIGLTVTRTKLILQRLIIADDAKLYNYPN